MSDACPAIEKFIEIENLLLVRIAEVWKGWSRKNDERVIQYTKKFGKFT